MVVLTVLYAGIGMFASFCMTQYLISLLPKKYQDYKLFKVNLPKLVKSKKQQTKDLFVRKLNFFNDSIVIRKAKMNSIYDTPKKAFVQRLFGDSSDQISNKNNKLNNSRIFQSQSIIGKQTLDRIEEEFPNEEQFFSFNNTNYESETSEDGSTTFVENGSQKSLSPISRNSNFNNNNNNNSFNIGQQINSFGSNN